MNYFELNFYDLCNTIITLRKYKKFMKILNFKILYKNILKIIYSIENDHKSIH